MDKKFQSDTKELDEKFAALKIQRSDTIGINLLDA